MVKRIVKFLIGEKNIQRIKKREKIHKLLKKELTYNEKSEADKVWIRTTIMAHSIEKSMAINDTNSLSNLNRYTTSIKDCYFLLEHGYSAKDYVIIEICSVLRNVLEYIKSEKMGNTVEVDRIEKNLDELLRDYSIECHNDAGIMKLRKDDLSVGKDFGWIEFARSRRSIRMFDDTFMDEEIIREIILRADSYPSACNRQPCKVYYGETKQAAEEIGKYVNDSRTVRENIHNFLIVTCDRNKFTDGELYQNYINGGIYLSYLVLAIHSMGLGSCIFQYVQNNVREDEFYLKMRIPSNESIIAFVGFGEIREENNVLCAHRQGFEDSASAIEISG